MAIATTGVRDLVQQGFDALRGGDAARARDAFHRAADAAPSDVNAWLGLAMACRAQKDMDASGAAIDRALALDAGNWRAMLMKADHFASLGDARAASSLYIGALRRAPPPNQLAPELQNELARARAMRERYLAEYEAYLHAQLAQRGLEKTGGEGLARFQQSLDLMLGKKQLYLQQPRFYYFPGLPQIQFYGREQFPWLDGIESATADIRAELIDVLKDENAFAPYIETKTDRPQIDTAGMVGNPSWSAFYLIKNGTVVAENAARCPKTLAAVGKGAACAHQRPHAVGAVFAALAGRAHPAAPRLRQHAPDLSSRAHRAAEMRVPRRQRSARLGRGQGVAVRRFRRA